MIRAKLFCVNTMCRGNSAERGLWHSYIRAQTYTKLQWITNGKWNILRKFAP